MNLQLSLYEVRTLLNWWASSRGGSYGSAGKVLGTLREITLADRLTEALHGSTAPAPPALRTSEETAARIVDEEVAEAAPALARHGYEVIFAGVVHSMSAADPAYWSVVDLQIEPAGAQRPTYRFFTSDISVWRDGKPLIGPAGETLRAAVRDTLAGWIDELERG